MSYSDAYYSDVHVSLHFYTQSISISLYLLKNSHNKNQ